MEFQAAKKMDMEHGDFYVEVDEGMYCVFGTESGFCYGTFIEQASAEEYATELGSRR